MDIMDHTRGGGEGGPVNADAYIGLRVAIYNRNGSNRHGQPRPSRALPGASLKKLPCQASKKDSTQGGPVIPN